MKNTASLQKNNEVAYKVRGMYGSAVNGVDTSYRSRARTATARTKIHPGEAGIVSGHRIRVNTKARPMLKSIGKVFTLRGILLLLLSILIVSAAVILMLFNFESATVYGNTKYSKEQIESFITRGYLGDNTVVMALKYHHRTITDIPFVDRIDIDIVNPSTVRVNIIEKPTDGCIVYKGSNVYFSNDGIIQTVSGRAVEETTIVNGVVLTHSTTGQQALAKNQLGLDLSLELMRAADKYGIRADSIDVDQKSNLTVAFGDVKVLVGKTGYDKKMFRMHQILPYLEGRSGTISMKGYADDYSEEDDTNIVLTPSTPEELAEKEQKTAEQAAAAKEDTAEAEEDGKASKDKSKDAEETKEEEAEQKDEKKTAEKGAGNAAGQEAVATGPTEAEISNKVKDETVVKKPASQE